jgi:hypothetical protein
MFGSRPRTRRPLLLLLVFGAFLAIIGITATARAQMAGATIWLPVIRRWLGGFGLRRRRGTRGATG